MSAGHERDAPREQQPQPQRIEQSYIRYDIEFKPVLVPETGWDGPLNGFPVGMADEVPQRQQARHENDANPRGEYQTGVMVKEEWPCSRIGRAHKE